MVAKMHRVHLPNVGEGVLYIPGGVPYEVVPVAEALTKYVPGSFVRVGNKEFIYATAGNTLDPHLGAKNTLAQKVGNSAIQDDYDAGVTTITLTVTAEIEEDELVGGEVVVFVSAAPFTRGIVSNTAVTGTATLTLVLDSPTPIAITTSDTGECMANPYVGVIETNDEWAPVMGMPTVVATEGQGLWLQVSGPIWAAPSPPGGSGIGGAIDALDVVFNSDGSFNVRDTSNKQHAGCIRAKGQSGQGAPFVTLQIAH